MAVVLLWVDLVFSRLLLADTDRQQLEILELSEHSSHFPSSPRTGFRVRNRYLFLRFCLGSPFSALQAFPRLCFKIFRKTFVNRPDLVCIVVALILISIFFNYLTTLKKISRLCLRIEISGFF